MSCLPLDIRYCYNQLRIKWLLYNRKPGNILKSQLHDHVNNMHRNSNLLFSEEYKLLKSCSPKCTTAVAELPENIAKNRYTNILPYDHSRVKLQMLNDDIYSDFINANYMPGYNSKKEFIASQGPLERTKSDFWRMVWEQNVSYVVMLTKLSERGKTKCCQYWPDRYEYYGDIRVTQSLREDRKNYIFRQFELTKGSRTAIITHFQYLHWPDFGCPEDSSSLIDFAREFRACVDARTDGPVVVQCSAGVGRTGTFICVDHLLQHIEDYDGIDIFGMAIELRQYRCNMIQTEDQYIFIHDCLRDAIQRQEARDSRVHDNSQGGMNSLYDRDDLSSQGSVRSKAGSLDGGRPLTKPSGARSSRASSVVSYTSSRVSASSYPADNDCKLIVVDRVRKHSSSPAETRRELSREPTPTSGRDHRKDSNPSRDNRKDSNASRDHRKDSNLSRDNRKDSNTSRDHRKESTPSRDHRKDSTSSRDQRKESTPTRDHRKISSSNRPHDHRPSNGGYRSCCK